MTSAAQSVLVTPNVLGADGVSCLSRQIARALPGPVLTLSLHDAPNGDPMLHGAGGSRVRFVTDALRVGLRCDRDTVIVCSHVHLAPVARAIAWRGAGVTCVLCGIEAWVPLRPLERWALASSRIAAISAHTARRFLIANPSFSGRRIEVCHPGLPLREGRDGADSLAGEGAALIVGRMAADENYKGHDELLRVWPRVVRQCPDARLWIVGDGDDRPRLEELAASLGLANAVEFTGKIPDDELDRRYRACRFFVMPSRCEGFGLVFLEAMRAAKACIGAPGAAEEIIEHGVTGLVVDPSNAEDLSGALVALFGDGDRCEAFGRAGEARFRALFTDTRFAARFAARPPARLARLPALNRP